MPPSPQAGHLHVSSPDHTLTFTLSPAITLTDFQSSPFSHRPSHTHRDGVRYTLTNLLVEGTPFNVTLDFNESHLTSLTLFLRQPTDASSWSSWSYDLELARRKAAEAWITQTFGQAPTLKPFLSDSGKEIIPALPDPNHPTYLKFPWGQVISSYDSRSGNSEVVITYEPPRAHS